MQKQLRGSLGRFSGGFMAIRRRMVLLALLVGGLAATTHADGPGFGLDARSDIGAYMNGILPSTGATPMPALLSQTGVFTDTAARTIHPGFVPYNINSPLWTDGADKSRFIALPYDSANPNDPVASPKITFAPTGYWVFPNGTVIVKNFDMKINEQTNAERRLETRILVRSADGTLRGASYKWREPATPGGPYTDADIVTAATTEVLHIVEADGITVRDQPYYYPSPSPDPGAPNDPTSGDCVRCHNAGAGRILGIRTAQLNGNFSYPSPGGPVTDNQLRTWDHIGMLNTPIPDPSVFKHTVDIADTSAPLELRVRSYVASNCSHCHYRPNGEGPIYDMRFDTSTQDTNIFGPAGGLIRDALQDSRLYVRDSALPGNFPSPMPPLARNVPDQRVLNVYDQWVNYSYDVMTATRLSATQVRLLFNRDIEPVSAASAANYAINGGITVNNAAMDGTNAVILTTSTLNLSAVYTVTINGVKELQAPQNAVFPNTQVSFPLPPDAPVLTGAQAIVGGATLSFTPPASNGGATITAYTASCTDATPATITANGTTSPITVTGLTAGTPYSCSLTATNSAGTSPASNAMNVTPSAPAPVLVSVFSRKTHGTAGPFNLPLDTNASQNGAVTIESRGGAHQIVFRFDRPVTTTGTPAATSGSVSASASGNEVIVQLSGVADKERVTVSLTNVSGANVNVQVSLGFLEGDVNGSGKIDSQDAVAMKARTGQVANEDNFRFDINLSGSLTASEVSAIKARNNRTLNS